MQKSRKVSEVLKGRCTCRKSSTRVRNELQPPFVIALKLATGNGEEESPAILTAGIYHADCGTGQFKNEAGCGGCQNDEKVDQTAESGGMRYIA